MANSGMKIGGFAQNLYSTSAKQKEELGTLLQTKDGRVFAYAKNGGSALAAAKVTQAAAPVSNDKNKAVTAAAKAGDLQVKVTLGGAVTADYYKDGYMHVNDEAGEGHIYRVKGHPAGTTDVLVDLYDPIRVALVAGTSEITFTKHPQDGVILYPTTGTSVPVGVPLVVVPENYYFWNQVKGPAPVLTDGTITIGQQVTVSDGTAGAVEAINRGGSGTNLASVGVTLQVNATAEYSLIMLAIQGY